MGFDLAGSMGSSSNVKRTQITNVSQAATSTAIGGTSQLGQIFLGRQSKFLGNLNISGPTDQSRVTSIERTGAVIPTISGSSDSATGAASSSVSPHLFGLTWTQWAIVGVAVLGLYWVFKRKKAG